MQEDYPMAGTTTNSADELMQAYGQAVSSGFAAADAGMAQATNAVKLITGAIQTERNEYGKVMEQAASHARARGENLAGAMQTVATTPPFTPEAKNSISKIVDGEMAFYQAWTKSWMDYLAGVEARRNAAAKAMLESNAKAVASSQEAMKSAVKYGEAFIEWSMGAAKGMKS